MTFWTDISGPQGMNLNNGCPLTLYLSPPAGQCFHLAGEISQHFRHGLAQNTDIHCSSTMNPIDINDSLTFPLKPLAG